MGLIETSFYRKCFHYGDGSGTDVAAHGHDHFAIQDITAKLREGKIPPNGETKRKATRYLRWLLDTAAGTGGNRNEHAAFREDINAYLPQRHRISLRDLGIDVGIPRSRAKKRGRPGNHG
ncbi:MAG TPA: hypothetical protein VJB96_03310 [Patescibacteria group bacterium]|nr:hypothetical protein [Patescibacteria group bacterium]